MRERLRIADIRLVLHGRATIRAGWVITLAEVLEKVPPPRVLRDAAGALWAVDGVHTLRAAASLGHQDWECEVAEGSEDDARLAAARANLGNGDRLPLDDADKWRVVELLLGHPFWSGQSNAAIAEEVGVSAPFVGKVRARTQNRFDSRRTGRDGRVTDTSRNGKSPALRSLAFVRLAASTGRETGYLTVAGGRVTALSEDLAASAPFAAASFDFRPRASEFFAALRGCRGGFELKALPDGRVAGIRGDLVVPVATSQAVAPQVWPSGADVIIGGDLLTTLTTLHPWVGDSGLLLTQTTARATNFRTAISLQLSGPLFNRDLRLPRKAVDALVELGDVPTYAQLDAEYLTLHLAGDRWLRARLLDPGVRQEEAEVDQQVAHAVDVTLPFDALRRVETVAQEGAVVVFCQDAVSTAWPPEGGIHVHVPGLPEAGAFPLEELLRLQGVVSVLSVADDGDACFDDGRGLRGKLFGLEYPKPAGPDVETCPVCGRPLP